MSAQALRATLTAALIERHPGVGCFINLLSSRAMPRFATRTSGEGGVPVRVMSETWSILSSLLKITRDCHHLALDDVLRIQLTLDSDYSRKQRRGC